jgi:hypothetical protein
MRFSINTVLTSQSTNIFTKRPATDLASAIAHTDKDILPLTTGQRELLVQGQLGGEGRCTWS